MDKYFTTKDAANYLGVTASRVRQFIAKERLESEKYGRDHMIKESELVNFAKHGKKKRGRLKKDSNQAFVYVSNYTNPDPGSGLNK